MSQTRSFITLDGLRGIAALAVVIRHCPDLFGEDALFESYLAVDFFFALSGFVLAHAYGKQLRKELSASHFMALRFTRLYPLYLLALAISLATSWKQLAHGELTVDLLFAVLFLPTLGNTITLFPLNGPSWSLFFELAANALFGLIDRRLCNYTLGLIVIAAGCAVAISVATSAFGFGHAGVGAMDAGYNWSSFGAGLLRVIYSFFAGVLVYRMRWPRLSGQLFRVDKWSVCPG
jgi:peptidoglycan/LPS O-acetylase OafA/YrhL